MTTVTSPADTRVQAIYLRGHLKLMAQGMHHSRLTRREVLNKATVVTRLGYANSVKGALKAIADLTRVIEG